MQLVVFIFQNYTAQLLNTLKAENGNSFVNLQSFTCVHKYVVFFNVKKSS